MNNEFVCPKLTLPTGHVLQSGTCKVKWIRDLYHKNKSKLISNMRMNRNIACIDNLSKQKVSPALALFSENITTALRDQHGDQAKGTWEFLTFFNDYIIQPLLTISASKGCKIKSATVFMSAEDARLECFTVTSDWLIKDWYLSLKNMPKNENNNGNLEK